MRNPIDRLTAGLPKPWRVTIDWLVTIAGAVALSAAEILGGWAAVYAVDPDARFNARAICNGTDMRTGEPAYSGPEVHLINLGVKEMFDEFFGGHCHFIDDTDVYGAAPCEAWSDAEPWDA